MLNSSASKGPAAGLLLVAAPAELAATPPHFRDVAAEVGLDFVHYNGVAAADIDGDEDADLIVSHLDRETNTLYINDGGGFFEDQTQSNGAVKRLEYLVRAKDPFPLHQRNQLFENLGGGRFVEISEQAGPAFALSEVSRGLAVGDVDNDGDADLLVGNNNGPVRLLRNEVGQQAPWLGLRLVTDGGRDALGARVSLKRGTAPALVRRAHSDGSYASASDPRVLFGLAGSPPASGLVVAWPDGSEEGFPVPAVGRYYTLRQGTGSAAPEATP